jgi:predicted nuclease of predicted toxin-antitoxin system
VTPVRYLFDEDCNARIVRGVRRRTSKLDLITVQETGLGSANDSEILAHAAAEGRIVVSHDVRTMTAHATINMAFGSPMAGLLLIPQTYPIGQAIEDLLLIAEVSTGEEWQGKILFLPL